MLDQIKKIGEAAKQVVLFILVPVFFVAGYVYYLLNKNKNLEDQLAVSEADKKLEGLKGEEKIIDSESDDVVERYRKLRNSYLSGSNSGLRSGDPVENGADPDKGQGDEPGGGAA